MSIRLAGELAQLPLRGYRRGLVLAAAPPLRARHGRSFFTLAAKDSAHKVKHDAEQATNCAKSGRGRFQRLVANLWFRRGLRGFRVGVLSFGLYRIGYVSHGARLLFNSKVPLK